MAGVKKEDQPYNKVLYLAIKNAFGSTSAFCRLVIMHETYLGQLINLELSPIGANGKWRKLCVRISEILELPPEILFPLDLYGNEADLGIEVCTENNLSRADWLKMQNSSTLGHANVECNEADLLTALEQAFGLLSPKEENILRMKFGLNPEQAYYTCNQIGEKFGLTGARVTQIVKKAIRKLRHPSIFNQDARRKLEEAWHELNTR